MKSRIVWREIRCSQEIDSGFLAFLRMLRPQNRRNGYTSSSNFPKYLDERTGEPKYDSNISLYGPQKDSERKN